MALPVVQVETRAGAGKGVARKLRAAGMAPAVCYGLGKDPLHLSVAPQAILQLLRTPRGRNSVVQLDVPGENGPRMALLKDMQIHPVKRRILHVDFQEVTADSILKVTVPIELTGKSVGEKAGGNLRWVLKEVGVACKPDDIPARVEVPITDLQIGQVLYVENISLPEGLTATTKPRVPIVAVRSGRAALPGEELEDEEGTSETAAVAE